MPSVLLRASLQILTMGSRPPMTLLLYTSHTMINCYLPPLIPSVLTTLASILCLEHAKYAVV